MEKVTCWPFVPARRGRGTGGGRNEIKESRQEVFWGAEIEGKKGKNKNKSESPKRKRI